MNSTEKQTVLHCLKSMIDEEVCEECPLYGTTGTDHCEKDCVRLAINELEQEPCDKYKKFAEFVMDEIFDKNWEYNAGGFAEIACRKLEKLGLVKGNDKEWVIAEQEPCDDEYIKVPKKALKYRTAGMVAYNVEWLKNHFDIERAVICGAQEPCTDAISRWIPITSRPMTEEEKERYKNHPEYQDDCRIFNCKLPDDGQEVLISVYGGVEVDTFVQDANDGCYFEGRDIDDVDAWMYLPEPYKQEVEE